MKKNLHKLRGVDVEVCSAEQMIAYNLACAFSEYEQDAERIFSLWTQRSGRYNSAAVFEALQNGLNEYRKRPFIATNYESVGKVFNL